MKGSVQLAQQAEAGSAVSTPEAQLRRWSRMTDREPVIWWANLKSEAKLGSIHLLFFLLLILVTRHPHNPLLRLLSIALLGGVLLPFLRVFMHSQAHWKIGNGPLRNWLLDRLISVLFAVPQTGYEMGHLAHHRYDNDFDPSGYPRDLQSTYIFSKDGRPCNIWIWCLFYIIVYQHAVHLFHVLNSRKKRKVFYFFSEAIAIVLFNAALYSYGRGFYLDVYLPSLGIAWFIVALSLYMMHAVDVRLFERHPTLNCDDPLFNWLGDNDGYHLEHSLYPYLHPVFLKEASGLIPPPDRQVVHAQYPLAAIPLLLGRAARVGKSM